MMIQKLKFQETNGTAEWGFVNQDAKSVMIFGIDSSDSRHSKSKNYYLGFGDRH